MKKSLRNFSVLAALSVVGAAYGQTATPSNTPSSSVMTPTQNPELDGASTVQRMSQLQAGPTVGGNVESGMLVKSPSGDVLGTVASIVPSNTNSSDGFVVVAGAGGAAIPLPYSTASSHVKHDTLVVDKARFLNAPKVQQYQTEDGSSSVWERKADDYWK